MPDHEHPNDIQRARRLLYAHCTATLLADTVPTDVRYLILPTTGQLIIDADEDIMGAEEHVLMIPEDRFDTPLSLLIDLTETESEEFYDRHRSYHGSTSLPRIAIASILCAKLDNAETIDQEMIQLANPLACAVSRLGRLLNEDRDALASVCEQLSATRPQDPTAVCVDPSGFHVRTRFGVIRVLFPDECPTEDEAEAMIIALLKKARS